MAHSFPSLDDCAIRHPENPADGCDFFRPLYDNDSAAHELSPHPVLGSSQAEDTRDIEDQVVQNGFKRGFEAGRQEACVLMRQEIIPEIKSFAHTFRQLNQSLHCNQDLSSEKMLEMALCVAGKILGAPPGVRQKALSGFAAELKEFLARSYRINLTFSDQDLDTLTEYLQNEDPHWQECDHIKVDSRDQVPVSSLQTEPGGHPLGDDGSLDGLMQSLERILQAPSTK